MPWIISARVRHDGGSRLDGFCLRTLSLLLTCCYLTLTTCIQGLSYVRGGADTAYMMVYVRTQGGYVHTTSSGMPELGEPGTQRLSLSRRAIVDMMDPDGRGTRRSCLRTPNPANVVHLYPPLCHACANLP